MEEADDEFIRTILLPEMVQDRCFCEPGSREFVEFESARVWPKNKAFYRAEVVIRFSGEPSRFRLLVKLLGDGDEGMGREFLAFQNEEMFYSKMRQKYGGNYGVKSYLSDLGRYGRAAIVLEDLEEKEEEDWRGYRDNKLDEDHLKLCVELLGSFHGRGLKLKAEKFNDFREFYAKLLEITFTEESLKYYEHRLLGVVSILDKAPEKIRRKLGLNPLETARHLATEINDFSTICHGDISPGNLVFKYENGKPIEARVIDWQTMRYSSVGIDLALLLFGNLVAKDRLVHIRRMLTIYLDAVKREYPEISKDIQRFEQDIVSKFPYAVILSFQERITSEELSQILQDLDAIS